MKRALLCHGRDPGADRRRARPGAAETPKQGGAATVTFNNDLTTLDPQVGYDWQNWSVIKSIFDGLMDYKPGTTELEPDLAESYTISDDGLTYTFKLRDGRQVPQRPGDDRGRRQVLVRARHQSGDPVARRRLSSAIAGYDDFVGGKAKELSGVTAPDDNTVVIKLSRPDATFLHVMAINFAYVVPKEAVEKAGADWGKKPVGTGAFKFVEWVPGQQIVLERNADYYRQGVPYLDKLTFEFGLDPTVAVLKLKNGELDIVGDGIPPAQFTEVDGRPRQQGPDRRRRPAAHRLRHHERDDAAVRQGRGAAGRQHGDQQGPHRQDHQQPRGAGEPGAAAGDARLQSGQQGLCLRSGQAPRRCWRRPASPTASPPNSTP